MISNRNILADTLLSILFFPVNLLIWIVQLPLRRNTLAPGETMNGGVHEQRLKILEFGYKAAIEEGEGKPLPEGTVLKKIIVKICSDCNVPYCPLVLTSFKTQGTRSCTVFSVGTKFDDWAILNTTTEFCEGVCRGLLSSSPGAGDGVVYIKSTDDGEEGAPVQGPYVEAFQFEIVDGNVVVRKTEKLPATLMESLKALSVGTGCSCG